MKKAVILICLLACSMGSEAQKKISLKNLDLSKVWQEYGTVITEDDTIKLHAPSASCFSAKKAKVNGSWD